MAMLTHLIRATAGLGGLFSLAMVVIAGDQSSLFMVSLMLVFGAWAVAPFALAYARASSFERHPAASTLLLLATIAATLFSIFVYWSTFIDNPNPDAQDGLILIFVPLYQILGIAIVVMILGFFTKHLN